VHKVRGDVFGAVRMMLSGLDGGVLESVNPEFPGNWRCMEFMFWTRLRIWAMTFGLQLQ